MTSVTPAIRVLFVCRANLVRSPLAEGVFRHLATARGLADRFICDSAGISAYEGMPPDAGSVRVAADHGIALTGRARQLLRTDLYDFDHVLVTDQGILDRIARLHGSGPLGTARVRLLMALVDPNGKDQDVPDPIGGGPAGYLHVYRMIHRACTALLTELAP